MWAKDDDTCNNYGISLKAISKHALTALHPSIASISWAGVAKTIITENFYFDAFKRYMLLESWMIKGWHKAAAAENRPLIHGNCKNDRESLQLNYLTVDAWITQQLNKVKPTMSKQ